MSGDNIHRGPWGDRADGSGGSGGEPPGNVLADRVASLEAGTKEMNATLIRIEITLGRIDERLGQFATREDTAQITGAVGALAEKVAGLAGRLDKVERTVDAKVLGPWQFPLILASSAAVLAVIAGAFNWVLTHGWIR